MYVHVVCFYLLWIDVVSALNNSWQKSHCGALPWCSSKLSMCSLNKHSDGANICALASFKYIHWLTDWLIHWRTNSIPKRFRFTLSHTRDIRCVCMVHHSPFSQSPFSHSLDSVLLTGSLIFSHSRFQHKRTNYALYALVRFLSSSSFSFHFYVHLSKKIMFVLVWLRLHLTVVRRSFLEIDKSHMRSHPFD